MQTSDKSLIERVLIGDAVAEEQLFKQYYPFLLTIARRYAKQNAEDVLQDAFMRIFKKLDTFDANKASFGSWAKTIVINTAISAYRKKRLVFERFELREHDQEVSPDIIDKLDTEALLKLINRLPDMYKVVFNLYVIDSYSHAEIAKNLNIKVSLSKKRLSRARQLLQKELQALIDREGKYLQTNIKLI